MYVNTYFILRPTCVSKYEFACMMTQIYHVWTHESELYSLATNVKRTESVSIKQWVNNDKHHNKPKLICLFFLIFSFQSPNCKAVNRMFTNGYITNRKQNKQEEKKGKKRRQAHLTSPTPTLSRVIEESILMEPIGFLNPHQPTYCTPTMDHSRFFLNSLKLCACNQLWMYTCN